MAKEGFTRIVNCITPVGGVLVLGRGYITQLVKLHYFFKILFSRPRHISDKLRVIIDDQERVYRKCEFHDLRCRGSYAESVIFLFLFLSTLGHGSEKLSI